ncbi:unnamed protein product, partial [Musa banksii]
QYAYSRNSKRPCSCQLTENSKPCMNAADPLLSCSLSQHLFIYPASESMFKAGVVKAKFMGSSNGVLKRAAKVLQRSLSCSGSDHLGSSLPGRSLELQEADAAAVPQDVKEGQFAVVAVWDEQRRRFVVSLRCLSNPVFLRLLELAEEEFGFRHEGAIAIPCRPSELERILRELPR